MNQNQLLKNHAYTVTHNTPLDIAGIDLSQKYTGQLGNTQKKIMEYGKSKISVEETVPKITLQSKNSFQLPKYNNHKLAEIKNHKDTKYHHELA